MAVTDKTSIVVQKDTNAVLKDIAEINKRIWTELALSNDLKRMELMASANRCDNLNEEEMQDYLSKVNNFFKIWRS